MKRVTWLQKFFDELQRDKLLRSSDIFRFFFSTIQKPQFDARKKELTKIPAPKNILEHKHFKGVAQTGLSDKKLDVARNIGLYTQACQNLYAKIIVATDDTVKLIKLVSDAFARNAELFKEIAAIHSEIESAELTDLFNMLRKINLSLSETYTKQATHFQDKYWMFFQYYKEELNSIKEVFYLFTKHII